MQSVTSEDPNSAVQRAMRSTHDALCAVLYDVVTPMLLNVLEKKFGRRSKLMFKYS